MPIQNIRPMIFLKKQANKKFNIVLTTPNTKTTTIQVHRNDFFKKIQSEMDILVDLQIPEWIQSSLMFAENNNNNNKSGCLLLHLEQNH